MKTNLIYIVLAFFLSIISLTKCKQDISTKTKQSLTVKDSIQIFSDSLFYVVENNYLHRKTIDWNKVKTQYLKENLASNTFMEAFYGLQAFFDSIDCNHCQVFNDKGFVKGTSKPLLYEDYSYEFGKKHSEGVKFSVSKLKNKYAYVEVPSMFYPSLSKDSIDVISQKMYDQIIELDKNNNPKGWILDLRFNTGGDAYLMLAALYHFLGDKVVYTGLDVNKNVISVNQLKAGKFISGETIEREINAKNKPNLNVPIAIIMGNWTASAGEDVIVGFTDRKNVITIGEPTYGYLTGNELYKLPFNAQAALTGSYIADMYGKYKVNLDPDISIKEKNSNFKNLLKDQNIIEAIKFIDSKN